MINDPDLTMTQSQSNLLGAVKQRLSSGINDAVQEITAERLPDVVNACLGLGDEIFEFSIKVKVSKYLTHDGDDDDEEFNQGYHADYDITAESPEVKKTILHKCKIEETKKISNTNQEELF